MKPSGVLEEIKNHYARHGCHRKDILVATIQIPVEVRAEDHVIKIHAEGSFRKEGEQGLLEDPIDIAKEPVKAAVEMAEEQAYGKKCTTYLMGEPQDYSAVKVSMSTDRITMRMVVRSSRRA